MSTPTVSIRTANPGDFHRVRGVLISSYLEYHDCLPPALFAAYLTDLVDLEGRADFGEIIVAERGGVIVGTATFYGDASDDGTDWPASASSIRAVATHPTARGLGIGRALLDTCQERAQRRGSTQLCLHTAPFMATAARLYEAAGFVRAPAHDVDVAARVPALGDGGLVISAYTLDLMAEANAA
jgi:ribosomal protein S18 acetylase RimI-like enzyme